MWVAKNGNLCYYSMKEEKRLIYMDRSKVCRAKISDVPRSAKKFAFKLEVSEEGGTFETACFAAESAEDEKKWRAAFNNVGHTDWFHPKTMMMTQGYLQELRDFTLQVKNRRAAFEATFKANLWKLKGDGNPKDDSHWFLREMWIA